MDTDIPRKSKKKKQTVPLEQYEQLLAYCNSLRERLGILDTLMPDKKSKGRPRKYNSLEEHLQARREHYRSKKLEEGDETPVKIMSLSIASPL